MKKLIKIAIGILLVGIIIIATDFSLLWLPLEHSPEYPAKVAALFMAVAALVTLVLALTSVKAIEQSNLRENARRTAEIEKETRDRKERLLDEIIEWAIDASKCDVALDPTAIVGTIGTEKARLFVEALTSKERTSITKTWGKSLYISKIVPTTWQDLQKAVEELIKDLGMLVDLLDECSDAVASNLIDAFGSVSEKVREHKLKLYKSVEKVIEEATKIKTKDIS